VIESDHQEVLRTSSTYPIRTGKKDGKESEKADQLDEAHLDALRGPK
jgi:hypothetical protein